MGDAADDVCRDMEHAVEMRAALRKACNQKTAGACRWFVNDDSLYECRSCGKVTDL
jgi:hypothetical protein